MLHRLTLIFIAAVVPLALLAACSDDDGNNEQDQTQAFCSDLKNLESDINGLLSSFASLDQARIQDSIDQTQDSVKEVKSSAQDLRTSEGDEIETAFNSLRDSVQALGQGGGLTSNLEAIESSARQLQSAVSSAVSSHRCA